MTKTTNSNYGSCSSPGSTFYSNISADSDTFSRNDIASLGSALDQHDHSSGKGLSVGLQTTTTAAGTSAGLKSNDGHSLFQFQNELVVANGSTAQLVTGNATPLGICIVVDTGGNVAIVQVRGGLDATTMLATNSSQYTITANNANTNNIYWSAGNSRYELQNKTGNSVNYAVFSFLVS